MRTSALSNAHSVPERRRGVDWKFALLAGFFIGVIFLFATGGNPWGFTALVVPSVMGREMLPRTHANLDFGYLLTHLSLAVVFGLLMAPVIHRFRIIKALFVALLFGFAFYGLNYLLFREIMHAHGTPNEVGVLITNLAFALLFAAAYRGKVRGDLNAPVRRDQQATGSI